MAKLKLRVASLEEVEEALRPLYSQSGSGYVLDADGLDELDRLAEFRESNRKMFGQLEAWKKLGMTPEQITAKLAEQSRADDEKLSAAELEAKYRKQLDDAKAEAAKQIADAQAKIDRYEILEPMRQAALKAGMIPADVDDVLELPSVRSRYRRGENGAVQILTPDGTPDINMDPGKFFEAMRKERPRFFQPVNPGGSGLKGGDPQPKLREGVRQVSADDSSALGASLADIASGKVVVVDAEAS